MVIKTQDLKENDKLVWLYSENLGKITAVAKGAKGGRSKFMSSTLPFCFGEYVVFKGKSLFTINECEIIDSFQALIGDLESLTYASYFCELIDICINEMDSSHNVFRMFVTVLYLMKSKAVDLEMLARSFELKLLAATGYRLYLDNCCICKKKIKTSSYISFQYSGGICNDCNKANGMQISNATYNLLNYLISLPLEKVYRVSVGKDIKDELNKVLSTFISNNYMKKPKSLGALKFFKEE